MNFLIVILIGALCGWLASLIMKTDSQQGAVANILIGIIGGLVGQLVFGTLLKIGAAQTAGQEISLLSVLWGVIGASLLIAILKAVKVLR